MAIVEPFEHRTDPVENSDSTTSGSAAEPTQQLQDRWTEAFKEADAGSLGVPPNDPHRVADAGSLGVTSDNPYRDADAGSLGLTTGNSPIGEDQPEEPGPGDGPVIPVPPLIPPWLPVPGGVGEDAILPDPEGLNPIPNGTATAPVNTTGTTTPSENGDSPMPTTTTPESPSAGTTITTPSDNGDHSTPTTTTPESPSAGTTTTTPPDNGDYINIVGERVNISEVGGVAGEFDPEELAQIAFQHAGEGDLPDRPSFDQIHDTITSNDGTRLENNRVQFERDGVVVIINEDFPLRSTAFIP